MNSKNAVGITAFAEAITCLAGFIVYLIKGREIDWRLTGTLIIFATCAVPFAALTVKNIYSDRLKRLIGVFIMLFGFMTIFKIAGG